MKGINYFTADQLKRWSAETEINGKWFAARPIGQTGLVRRFKLALKVFTGELDVVKFYKQ